jgi:hypothetical protein
VPIALAFIGGLLVATGLMVQDEILTLARYSADRTACNYPIPLVARAGWDCYDASGFAWVLILAGIAAFVAATTTYYRWLNRWLAHQEAVQKCVDEKVTVRLQTVTTDGRDAEPIATEAWIDANSF